MKNKILGIAATPIAAPLILIQLHYAGKPSSYAKDQARRQQKIDALKANRRNR